MPSFRLLIGLILSLLPVSLLAQNSVLASGEWYKIAVSKAGIYKIDLSFLQKAGINTAALNPQNIHLYGYGGGMLPQANHMSRPADLPENAIFVEGEADGRFDNADYILFYAQSPHAVYYDTTQKIFRHQTNLYSDTTFYFLTVSDTPGLRIEEQESESNAVHTITSFDDYLFHEKELTNQIQSGREWYGEKFDFTVTQHIDFPVTGLVAGSEIKITSAVMAQASGSTQFSLALNGQEAGSHSLPGVSSGTYDVKGVNRTNTFTVLAPATDNLKLTYTYDKKGLTDAAGYLNFAGLQVKRELKAYADQTTFMALESMEYEEVNYIIKDATSQLNIWDITNPQIPANQIYALTGSTAVFGAKAGTNAGSLKEYILFSGTSFDNPVSVQRIANQNLHALSTPQFLIITPGIFKEQAIKLADFRKSHDGLQTEVATLDEIYNEFSSGRQDVSAIRDFIRYLYTRNQSLQYVLLVGDASYDYKNRISPHTNFVPIYESRESLHPIFSYSSDDYYGFMDDNEGEWTENTQGDHIMDIAVGRLPVKSVEEASNVMSKLIRYATDTKTLGKWRNQLSFVADDGDNNTHQLDADRLAEQIAAKYPAFNINKIFMDAYPQVSNANGQTAPEVQKAIDKAIDKGSFILNYTGHGGEIGWSQEQILSIPQINEWNNIYLPLMVTATCEFGRYDDPVRTSGAEYALLHAKGGAIGLITTTRPVFSNTNYALNTAFYSAVFEPQNGQMPRLGDVMKHTKNNSLSGSINRNFALLGDPSMRLAYPEQNISISKINKKDISAGADTLKALSKVSIEGYLQDRFSGQLQSEFNGLLYATVFDKKSTLTTLGTERSARMNFKVQQNILFEGKVSVKNGVFELNFVVPKDIDYRFDAGKISMYAQNETGQDANGSQQVMIGGSIPLINPDQTPPLIRLFMNDTTFVDGSITGSNTALMALLSDENGINVTQTGIGHGITATLHSTSEEIVLNEYYTASIDDYRKGQIYYPFKNLAPGSYTLTLKAWDTYNNSSQADIRFIVANSEAIALRNVLNVPNPFRDFTQFQFDHNRAGEDLEITVDIYSLSGQIIKTLHTIAYASPEQFKDLRWDGKGDYDNKIHNGVYIYKLSVRSMADGSQTHLFNRLVIFQ
ncbi:type IX secretion system sortase PorU [Rhodocytophaga rosea]|uniref:Type IX secretion system sortase PorU n=1 Tax=Rhodocytophaga rosea TaxID=2704465 RepID=A0A6C0GRM1_9BACT|nr:type IX secretion system sortase PorU [Rhodocytophaga rosea]QHT70192.1 type IX secretion system sortase PorU [Rhodocytophaga rosea]